MAELGAWFEIDLDHIVHNLRTTRDRIGAGVEVMTVVKNDAYGHGLRPLVAALAGEGINWFMVARTAEALAIQDFAISCGINCRIMNMDALYTEWQYCQNYRLHYRLWNGQLVKYRLILRRLI